MKIAPSAPYLWMLASALAFALMGATTHTLGGYCHWLVIASTRALLVLVLAVLAARVCRVPLIFWKPPTIWVRSIAGSISLLCNFFSLTRLPLADSLTLLNLYPLWVAVLSWVVLRHPPSLKEIGALASGLTGILLIVQPGFRTVELATLVALVGSVATACAMLGLHRLRNIDPWAIVAHFSGLASILTVGCWLVADREWSADSLDPAMLGLLLLVGIFATLGQVCMTRAYAYGQPTAVGVAGLTQVVFGMTLDVLFWGRTFTLTTLLGILLVMAPSVWLLLRRKTAAEEFLLEDGAEEQTPPTTTVPAGTAGGET